MASQDAPTTRKSPGVATVVIAGAALLLALLFLFAGTGAGVGGVLGALGAWLVG